MKCYRESARKKETVTCNTNKPMYIFTSRCPAWPAFEREREGERALFGILRIRGVARSSWDEIRDNTGSHQSQPVGPVGAKNSCVGAPTHAHEALLVEQVLLMCFYAPTHAHEARALDLA